MRLVLAVRERLVSLSSRPTCTRTTGFSVLEFEHHWCGASHSFPASGLEVTLPVLKGDWLPLVMALKYRFDLRLEKRF